MKELVNFFKERKLLAFFVLLALIGYGGAIICGIIELGIYIFSLLK